MTMPPALREFLRAAGLSLPEGRIAAFAGRLWLLPPGTPALQGLRALRPGLCLGQEKKGRFEPDHALSHYISGPVAASFPPEAPEAAAYLRGEALPGDCRGWGLLAVDGLPLGWVKGSGGVLKNHYPRGLRRP